MGANAAAQALDVTSELDFLNELAGVSDKVLPEQAAGNSNVPSQLDAAQTTAEPPAEPAAGEKPANTALQAAMDTSAELAFLDQLGGAEQVREAGSVHATAGAAPAPAGDVAADEAMGSQPAAPAHELKPEVDATAAPQGQDHDAQQGEANDAADTSAAQAGSAVKQEAREDTFEKDATELLSGFKDGAEAEKAEPVDAEALMKQFLLDMKDVDRNSEVDRVLWAFKLNPFEKLNLRFTATAADVKKAYRQISVLIHPDRCKHPRASDAFEVLNAAHAEILDEAQREQIMRVLEYARDAVREERRKATKHDSAIRIAASLHRDGRAGVEAAWEETEDFHEKWRVKARDVLARSEFRRRKLTKRVREEELRLEAKDEDKKQMRKQEAQDRKDWLAARSNRLNAWKDFTQSGKKGMGTKAAKIEKLDEERTYVHRTTQEQFVGNYRKKPRK